MKSPKAEQESNEASNTIKEDDHVIIKKLHDKTFGRLIKIDSKCSFLIGKIKYNIRALLGKEFGSIYTVNNKTKCLDFIENFDELFDFKTSISELKDEEEIRDNRTIMDDNRSQKLTTSDINNFKEDGLTTKKIIETIVENSSTFNLKTIYSQEKYLKKKQEKYSSFLRVYKPNSTLLVDMWFNQGAYKTANLRMDSLAQILNLCNVRSGCKYLVVDNYFGLVSAAVLERMIGDGSPFNKLKTGEIDDVGKCVQIITDHGPVASWRQAVEALNFKQDHLKHCLLSAQIHKTVPLITGQQPISNNHSTTKAHQQNNKNKSTNTESSDIMQESESNERTSNEEIEPTTDESEDKKPEDDELENEFRRNKRVKLEEKFVRKQKRTIEENQALELMSKRNFDGLIVIIRNQDPSELVDHLLNFLLPSAQFIVFSECVEPLTKCYSDLRSKTVNVKLSELWMRNFQILPMRSRPEVDMSGKSGYILHGVKLCLDYWRSLLL